MRVCQFHILAKIRTVTGEKMLFPLRAEVHVDFFCTPSLFKVRFISFSDLLKPRKLTLNVGMKKKLLKAI